MFDDDFEYVKTGESSDNLRSMGYYTNEYGEWIHPNNPNQILIQRNADYSVD